MAATASAHSLQETDPDERSRVFPPLREAQSPEGRQERHRLLSSVLHQVLPEADRDGGRRRLDDDLAGQVEPGAFRRRPPDEGGREPDLLQRLLRGPRPSLDLTNRTAPLSRKTVDTFGPSVKTTRPVPASAREAIADIASAAGSRAPIRIPCVRNAASSEAIVSSGEARTRSRVPPSGATPASHQVIRSSGGLSVQPAHFPAEHLGELFGALLGPRLEIDRRGLHETVRDGERGRRQAFLLGKERRDGLTEARAGDGKASWGPGPECSPAEGPGR